MIPSFLSLGHDGTIVYQVHVGLLSCLTSFVTFWVSSSSAEAAAERLRDGLGSWGKGLQVEAQNQGMALEGHAFPPSRYHMKYQMGDPPCTME